MSDKLPYVYTALLDVLGYRQRLEVDRQTGTLAFKDALNGALQVLASINEAEVSYQAISDTVILTCSDREHLLRFLQILKKVQIAFLGQGLFIRGGVTYGQHFKSGNITYSHAVASAYEIENKLAIVPRIVIDHNIIDMLRSSNDLQPIIDRYIVCVANGVHFIDIADASNWNTLFDMGRQLYFNDQQILVRKESEFAKHLWFQNYLLASPHKMEDALPYIPGMRSLE
jgi:hypothetical protein